MARARTNILSELKIVFESISNAGQKATSNTSNNVEKNIAEAFAVAESNINSISYSSCDKSKNNKKVSTRRSNSPSIENISNDVQHSIGENEENVKSLDDDL